MKYDDNSTSGSSNADGLNSRRTSDHTTVLEAARLSTVNGQMLPTSQRPGLTKSDLMSLIQRALDLVDAELDDDDDFICRTLSKKNRDRQQ
jgi:hypothetical protein